MANPSIKCIWGGAWGEYACASAMAKGERPTLTSQIIRIILCVKNLVTFFLRPKRSKLTAKR